MDLLLDKIKLVIFDLDDTFWSGTLSDGNAKIIEENITLINNMLDAGVMASICSKNDITSVENFLAPINNMWESFVFKSINWSPKGERVHQIISQMQLRAQNVLFIDDNPGNLNEVASYNDGIMLCGVEGLPILREFYSKAEKKDKVRNRLKQYHILESKAKFLTITGNNDDFLNKSNIRVEIHNDVLNHIDRIYDLVQRSNQLNFTKIRSSRNDLTAICVDEDVKKGYVIVKDLFGDYGIVGFFAIHGTKALHFVFSCRTLNMGIEQYVYHEIGCPEIDIQGEVASALIGSKRPEWINKEIFPEAQYKEKEALVGGGYDFVKRSM